MLVIGVQRKCRFFGFSLVVKTTSVSTGSVSTLFGGATEIGFFTFFTTGKSYFWISSSTFTEWGRFGCWRLPLGTIGNLHHLIFDLLLLLDRGKESLFRTTELPVDPRFFFANMMCKVHIADERLDSVFTVAGLLLSVLWLRRNSVGETIVYPYWLWFVLFCLLLSAVAPSRGLCCNCCSQNVFGNHQFSTIKHGCIRAIVYEVW